MNTSALKTFAPAVRQQLMEAVTRKLDFALTAQTPDYLTTFAPQVAALRKLAQADRSGLIERVAYTWFNRFAALRFMDARGWHPFRARVLTPASAAETQPELLKVTRTGALPEELKSHTDPARLNDLLDGRIPSPDPQGEVYRHLVLAACRFYHALLPNLFEKLDDETELLLPDDLLTEHSVVHGFRTEISDEDCGDGQRANVEILGWLYQFYISERKDQVMARKSAVPTEDIPAVTQLFTPHWIVRYLVENSLGRLWLLNRPGSRLREHMPYYIEGEKDAPGGSPDDFLKITRPEEIRLCDPAVGSGHMLTYAFDLLTLIYEEEGYAPTEIPALILRHNLHGLEICPRAAQLAELALVFKAREKSRRFFQPEHLVRPRIIELRDVRFAENELRDYIHALGLGDLFNQPMLRLLHQFEEAKNFGSLIQPCLNERSIAEVLGAIEAIDLGGQLFLIETQLKILRVLEQAEALTQRYHVVVANPPYLNEGNMNALMKVFAGKTYPDSKADLFAMFIQRNLCLTLRDGLVGMITMQSWMFISTYQRLRLRILDDSFFACMGHLGPRAFDSISGEVVQTTMFVVQNASRPGRKSVFQNLVAGRSESEKEAVCLRGENLFEIDQSTLKQIGGNPICYWVSSAVRNAFVSLPKLSDCAEPRVGLQTSNNQRFIRLWHEIGLGNSSLSEMSKYAEAIKAGKKWFPHNKGGENLKWYGSNAHVVNWRENGKDIKDEKAENLRLGLIEKKNSECWNSEFYFREGITWTRMSSGKIRIRFSPRGFVFDTAAPTIFSDEESGLFFLGLLNSAVAQAFAEILNPTLSFQSGDIRRIPVVNDRSFFDPSTVRDILAAYRADWDNFETSWDFRDQPLLRPGLKSATLEASWRNWEAQSTAAIRRMQELETENNRLFIAAYGLDGELQPEVPEAQITLARAEARRDMAAFLSYAVGCMMGRYSPDHPGLILANAGDTLREFLEKVGKPLVELTFAPDEDGIIPVLDGEWFEDDIVARTRDFLRATFGEATLRENLRYLEDSLGKDLRKYFLNDFYKDHLQTYKKRPIYWLVQSPKKGFSALVYVHRYTKDTVNTLLNKYLREYIKKIDGKISHLEMVGASADSTRERASANKELEKLRKILKDCQDWERDTFLPLAQKRLEIDLDDGVKANYLRFGNALAAIPGLATKEKE